LLDINDPEQIEWIDLGPEHKYLTGEAVPFFLLEVLMIRLCELSRIPSWPDIIGP